MTRWFSSSKRVLILTDKSVRGRETAYVTLDGQPTLTVCKSPLPRHSSVTDNYLKHPDVVTEWSPDRRRFGLLIYTKEGYAPQAHIQNLLFRMSWAPCERSAT